VGRVVLPVGGDFSGLGGRFVVNGEVVEGNGTFRLTGGEPFVLSYED
jgi:hypothetical protein